MSSYTELSRRGFVTASTKFLTAGSLGNLLFSFPQAVASNNSPSDYKALICVNLLGGNDNHNTLIPFEGCQYQAYRRARPNLAIDQSELKSTLLRSRRSAVEGCASVQYALHPQLRFLSDLYNKGDMAILPNVGPLRRPTTVDDFLRRTHIPTQLFSHSDQTAEWLAASSSGIGWGRKLSETDSGSSAIHPIAAINLFGFSNWLQGGGGVQFLVDPRGPRIPRAIESGVYGSREARDLMSEFLHTNDGSDYSVAYSGVVETSLALNGSLRQQLSQLDPAESSAETANRLARQLLMAVDLMRIGKKLGLQRQVFFLALPGFDTHSNLRDRHDRLMATLDAAIMRFVDAAKRHEMEEQFTMFTVSEFGRAARGNSSGSDHGWGGCAFVVGRAVNGGQFYGGPPVSSDDSMYALDGGRLIPTLSVEQLIVPMARWFGLREHDILEIVPRIRVFPEIQTSLYKA